MWSEDWGAMIWGSPLAVPTMGVVGFTALVVGLLLGAWFAQRRPFSRGVAAWLVLAGVVLPVIALGNITLPHGFVNGTVADADEVNANFDAIHQDFARYSLVATNQGATTAIPQSTTDQLCADGDGCTVRISMRLWSGGGDLANASAPPFLLFVDSGTGIWRTSNNVAGQDGNNSIEHLFDHFNLCYFTDGQYADYDRLGDPTPGFGLLVWNSYGGPNRECHLTLTD